MTESLKKEHILTTNEICRIDKIGYCYDDKFILFLCLALTINTDSEVLIEEVHTEFKVIK